MVQQDPRDRARRRHTEAVAEHDQGDRRRAEPSRHELHVQRPDQRNGAAKGEAIEEPQREQLVIASGEGHQDGQGAEHPCGENDRRAPAQPVADPAEKEAAQKGAEDADAEDVAEQLRANVKRRFQAFGCEGNHVHVEAVEEGHQP